MFNHVPIRTFYHTFVILSKLEAFLVFKYLILSLISSIVFFWFRESIGLELSGSMKFCFVKLQFFVVDYCSVYLIHSMMGEFDISVSLFYMLLYICVLG